MSYFPLKGGTGTQGRWSGKTWNALGDSNTENNHRAERKYPDFIAERINCISNNYGYSGYGFLDRGDGKALYTKINETDNDADLISILAGGNDVRVIDNGTIPIGSISDGDPAGSYYGALNHTFGALIERFPTKTVIALSQMRRGEGKDETIQDMVRALKDVCGTYGVPVLDLYNGGNVHAYNDVYIQECMPDGVHLNDKGSELLSWKIQSFIESV